MINPSNFTLMNNLVFILRLTLSNIAENPGLKLYQLQDSISYLE